MTNKNGLQRISITVSRWGSSTTAFCLSILGVLIWLAFGPSNHFSNTWLLSITVITDVIIFIMVFSIQNTQARDSKAIQLKLNELITADKHARDTFIGLETMTDAELAKLDEEFKNILLQLEVHPVVHKLHAALKQEKNNRPNFYQQAEHLVGAIFSPLTPLNGNDEHKKV